MSVCLEDLLLQQRRRVHELEDKLLRKERELDFYRQRERQVLTIIQQPGIRLWHLGNTS